MYIKPKANAKSLWDVIGDLASEVRLIPKDEEVPCPWDADVEVKGDTVVIEGGMAPGGPSFGKCVCTLPVSRFSDFMFLELPDDIVSDKMSEQDLQALWDAGWERA